MRYLEANLLVAVAPAAASAELNAVHAVAAGAPTTHPDVVVAVLVEKIAATPAVAH